MPPPPPVYDVPSESSTQDDVSSTNVPTRRIRSRILGGFIIIISLGILTAAVVYTCFSNVEKAPEFEVDCGRPGPLYHKSSKPSDKDVWKASEHQYPFYALFFTSGDHRPFCAGVAIAKHWILTSAHCVVKKQDKMDRVKVTLGLWHKAHLLRASRAITRIVIHEGYKYPQAKNDIALVKIPSHATSLDLFTSSVCMEEKNNETFYDDLLIAGFGTTAGLPVDTHDSSGDHLSITTVDPLEEATCQEEFKDNFDSNMLCVRHWNSSSSKEKIGDSGGPLFYTDSFDRTTLVALNTCDAQGELGLYVRVSNYYEWILNVIN